MRAKVGIWAVAAGLLVVVLLPAILLPTGVAHADVFNLGDANYKNLEFVSVGDRGNAPDTTGYGAVAYTYKMGMYDVTAAQYCAFLNAVASTSDPYGIYNPYMAGGPGDAACGITRTGTAGNYAYDTTSSGYVGVNSGNFPVNYVSWGDAARFCNWLTNGQPTGAAADGSTENGSYALNGAMDDASLMKVAREANARYAIPTENEWYKAAYYDPNKPGGAGYWLYPTRSDTAPSNTLAPNGTNNANYYAVSYPYHADQTNLLTVVGAFAGSPGPYGTYDMGGDVLQWNEANAPSISGEGRCTWGGSFAQTYYLLQAGFPVRGIDPAGEGAAHGFRVAEIPEPCTLSVLTLAGAGLLLKRRGRRR